MGLLLLPRSQDRSQDPNRIEMGVRFGCGSASHRRGWPAAQTDSSTSIQPSYANAKAESEGPLPLYRELLPQPDGRRLGPSPQERRPGTILRGNREARDESPCPQGDGGGRRRHLQTMVQDPGRHRSRRVRLRGHGLWACGRALPNLSRQDARRSRGLRRPPKLTKHLPDGEEKLAVYRRVRDEIRRFVETLPEALKPGLISNPPGNDRVPGEHHPETGEPICPVVLGGFGVPSLNPGSGRLDSSGRCAPGSCCG